MNKVFFAALTLSLALCLSGCVSLSLTPSDTMGAVLLPEPEESAPAAPVGDSRADSVNRVYFYFVGSDLQQLSPVMRTIRLSGEETLIEKTVERLLGSSSAAGLLPVAPDGTRLLSVELAQGIAVVDLSVDALAADAQELCWMRAALADTLTGLPGVNAVNLLIGGKEESVLSLPTGAQTENDGNLTALWAQLQIDEERFRENPASASIERYAVLYYGSWQDGLLLPELRAVRLSSDNFSAAILRELGKEPRGTAQAHAVLPEGASLERPPETVALADGRRVILLRFAENLDELMARDALSQYQLMGALTLSLCRFVPEIDGLIVEKGAERVYSIEEGERSLRFADGVMRPEDFSEAVGQVAKLYFAAEEGGLIALGRSMRRAEAVTPRALIRELIAGPYVFDAGAKAVIPEGVGESDILGVRVEDGVALVNLSANFYRLCQGLDGARERDLVYAMVNTLCELSEINAVRFFIAGDRADTLAGTISLKGPLLPNAGLAEHAAQ